MPRGRGGNKNAGRQSRRRQGSVTTPNTPSNNARDQSNNSSADEEALFSEQEDRNVASALINPSPTRIGSQDSNHPNIEDVTDEDVGPPPHNTRLRNLGYQPRNLNNKKQPPRVNQANLNFSTSLDEIKKTLGQMTGEQNNRMDKFENALANINQRINDSHVHGSISPRSEERR